MMKSKGKYVLILYVIFFKKTVLIAIKLKLLKEHINDISDR